MNRAIGNVGLLIFWGVAACMVYDMPHAENLAESASQIAMPIIVAAAGVLWRHLWREL